MVEQRDVVRQQEHIGSLLRGALEDGRDGGRARGASLGLEELEDGERLEGEEACCRMLVRGLLVIVVVFVGGVETDRADEGGRLLAAEDFVKEGGCCGGHFFLVGNWRGEKSRFEVLGCWL